MKKFRLAFFKSRLNNNQGFTIIEVVMAAVVLLGSIITMISVLDMAVKMLVTTNVRTLATMIANQEIETIRNLEYEKVNNDIPAQWPNDPKLIVDNFPDQPARYVDVDDFNQVTTYTLETTVTGSIKMEEMVKRKNFNYTIRRYVALVPTEATSAATAYYKRIIVKVSWEQAPVSEITVRTNIAKQDNNQPAPTVKILGIKSSFYNVYTNQTYDETQSMGDYVRGSVTAFAVARHNSAKATGIKSVTFSLYRPDGSFATSTTASLINNLYQWSFSTTPYTDGYGYVLKAEATDDSTEALTDSTSIKFGIDNTPPDISLLNVKATDVPGTAKRMQLLIWGATDNLGVYKYLIWRRDQNQAIKQIAAVAPNTDTDTVTFIDAGLVPQTFYTYRVYVVDNAGNMSSSSDRDAERAASRNQVDFTSPSAPTGIATDTVSWRTNNIWWARGVDTDTYGYHIYGSKNGTNFTVVGQVDLSGNSTETFQDVDLKGNSWYWYYIKTYDFEGNISSPSVTVKIFTP